MKFNSISLPKIRYKNFIKIFCILTFALSFYFYKKNDKKRNILPIGSDEFFTLFKTKKLLFEQIPLEYTENKAFVSELIGRNSSMASQIPTKYFDDPEILLPNCRGRGYIIEYASERLKSDEKFAIKCISLSYSGAFENFSENIRDNPEILDLAIKTQHSSSFIKSIPSRLLTRERAFTILKKSSSAYQYLPENFKGDAEMLNYAIKEGYSNFLYIPLHIKNDEKAVLDLVKWQPYILNLDFPLKYKNSFKEAVQSMVLKNDIPFDNYSHLSYLNILKFSDYVQDDGNVLKMKLQNGTFIEVLHPDKTMERDIETMMTLLFPSFTYYLKEFGFYVVQFNYHEGQSIVLYDDITGKKFYLSDFMPIFSPNKKHLIYVHSDESSFYFNGMIIFEIAPHYIKKVFEKEGDEFNFVEFNGDENFIIENPIYNQKRDIVGKKRYIVNKKTGEWQIDEL